MPTNIEDLESAYWQEALAKAKKQVLASYTRRQMRWLPLIENFWGRTQGKIAEQIYDRHKPVPLKRLHKVNALAAAEKVKNLIEEQENAQQVAGYD